MALPQSIDPATPGASDLVGQGDDQIRALKQAIVDINGLPSATNINNALFTASASGLLSAVFQNAGANPTIAGQLMRNSNLLKWHDGAAARTILTDVTGAIATAGVVYGNLFSNIAVTTNGAFTDVSGMTGAVTIPTGCRFVIAFFFVQVQITGAANGENKLQLNLSGIGGQGDIYNNNTVFSTFQPIFGATVWSAPTSGARTISIRFRNTLGTTTIMNNGSEGQGQRPVLGYLVTM